MPCSECERLWSLYAYAAYKHSEVARGTGDAAMSGNPDWKREMKQAVDVAGEWREMARRVLRDHEASHHNEGTKRQHTVSAPWWFALRPR